MFHFDKDFTNKNNERLMLPIRIKSLLRDLKNKYVIKNNVSNGDFEILIKECAYSEAFNSSGWKKFRADKDLWGQKDLFVWFRQTITIPVDYKGEDVIYVLNPYIDREWPWGQPQIEMYIDGKCICGLDSNHRSHMILKNAKGNEEITVYLKAYSDRTYYNGQMTMQSNIMVVRPLINKLYNSIDLPLRAAALMNSDSDSRVKIVNVLNKVMNTIDFYSDPESKEFLHSINEAFKILDDELYDNTSKDLPVLHAIGHSHIDVAWLWPYRVTRNKACRTFANSINLIENNDDYLFMSSQPQLYEFVKEDEPQVYEKIKKAVKEGRWETEGGMWVEADTNMTSGESLVRQFLFGKRFFKEEFGKENEVLWLPDVFGYSANLPQICKKSGINYFYTTKIGWNEYDKFPYDTFNWRGIDGTPILTHFGCAIEYKDVEKDWMTTYNPDTKPEFVIGAWNRYQQKDLNRDILYDFGYGDGGGGPTQQMIDELELYKKGVPGCPTVKFGTVKDFFKKLDKDVSTNKHLPEWNGEMYLEFHRGTYTSQAHTKKNNRTSEHLYHDVENLSSFASILENKEYPQKEINQNWKKILLNQFHDVLPGSSIKEVYDDVKGIYKGIISNGMQMEDDAINTIASDVNVSKDSVIVFNTLSFDRDTIVTTDKKINSLVDSDGNRIPCQRTFDNKTVFIAKNVPSKGYKTFRISSKKYDEVKYNNTTSLLENDKIKVVFDSKMHITSLFNKIENKETIPQGMVSGKIVAYEDVCLKDDAWNVQAYYEEKSFDIDDVTNVSLIENGPVRSVISVTRKFRNSTVTTRLSLYCNIGMLYYNYDIDWHEHNLFVKAEYPVDVNAKNAAYDIQFSYIERPVHKNTLWDFARFECCGHKWADLSDNGYGLSIINDSKYGFSASRNMIKISLLKCSTYPDKTQDQGHHEFSYAIYPHGGNHIDAKTNMLSYDFNYKAIAKVVKAQNGNLENTKSLFRLSSDNVYIETIKKAEDSDDLVLRLYESENKATNCTLYTDFDIVKASETNLMEKDNVNIKANKNSIELSFKPFEIKTILIKK